MWNDYKKRNQKNNNFILVFHGDYILTDKAKKTTESRILQFVWFMKNTILTKTL